MTKLREIVKDAFKCDELVYQFARIDLEDGLVQGESIADIMKDVNEKYSDEYILKEALNRLDIAHSNMYYLQTDEEMYKIHAKEAKQLDKFLTKHAGYSHFMNN